MENKNAYSLTRSLEEVIVQSALVRLLGVPLLAVYRRLVVRDKFVLVFVTKIGYFL